MSKKRCFEKYYSCGQACQFSASYCFENLTIDENLQTNEFDFLYIKTMCPEEKIIITS